MLASSTSLGMRRGIATTTTAALARRTPWRRRASLSPPSLPRRHRAAAARPPSATFALALAASASEQQQQQPAPAAAAPPAPAPAPAPAPPAAPAAPAATDRYIPGNVLEISGPEDYALLRAAHPNRLVVLMCKARSCRPCKAFSRKFAALAARFPEACLLEIYGDDSPATRQMMIAMQVRVTPTFRLTRGGEEVGALTGTSDAKLRDGIVAALTEGERAAHPEEVELMRAAQEAAKEAALLEAATQEKHGKSSSLSSQ